MGRLPDQGTTRRIVSDFIVKQAEKIVAPVAEIGSARPKEAWWADFRQQLDMDEAEWVGFDMQGSDCTDVEWDLTDMAVPNRYFRAFRSCVCSEVLEHVEIPENLLWSARQLLVPGSWIVITTPFAFPPHGFPNDYWRFTGEGLKLLLRRAGYVDILAWELERRDFLHRDHLHTEPMRTRKLPLWMGAVARVPYDAPTKIGEGKNAVV